MEPKAGVGLPHHLSQNITYSHGLNIPVPKGVSATPSQGDVFLVQPLPIVSQPLSVLLFSLPALSQHSLHTCSRELQILLTRSFTKCQHPRAPTLKLAPQDSLCTPNTNRGAWLSKRATQSFL